jgi:hypothetical protein
MFKQERVKYNGHILTTEGMLPDPAKVEAITEMPRPRDKAEVKWLLGMIIILESFCHSFLISPNHLEILPKKA